MTKRSPHTSLIYSSLLVGLLVLFAWLPAHADSFLGVEVKPDHSTFIVTKDVNVRALPKTASKRLSRLKKGVKVQGVGRPKDSAWLAVKQDGKDLGFVYSPVLLSLLDGTVEGELRGYTDAGNGRTCRYGIRFEGKSQAGDKLFEIADYEVAYACIHKGVTLKFIALMFMTEAPFRVFKALVHQVTVDVQGVGQEVEEVFSTNFLFNPKKKLLIFDGLSSKKLGKAPSSKKRTVDEVESVLRAAVEITPSAWKEEVWKILKKEKS